MDSCNGGNDTKKGGHVVVISYPATGHTNPMLQFSKNLASTGNLLVTFVTFNYNHRKVVQASESLKRLKLDIRFECIPDGLPEDDPSLDSNINPVVFKHMLDNMDGSGLEHLIRRLNANALAGDNHPPVSCIIYNSFLPWVRDVANKLGIPQALFWTQSAAVFSIYHHFRNKGWDCDKMPEIVTIPGLPELKSTDLPSAFLGTSGFIKYYLRQLDVVKDVSWVIANTVYDLEPEIIDSLKFQFSLPFLPIGPSIPRAFLQDPNSEDRQVGANPWKAADSMEWLNEKPPMSVLYISFGSILVLSEEQIIELALGIQQSGRNFVWVIRAPPGHGHIGEVLPEGFVDETKERGLVVDWCAQLEVLSHPSVGAFMSHCGWNSTLDALSLGVPMVTLGVWTDQPTNSKFVSDVWKTGVRMRRGDDGVVGREETERCIRAAMELGSEEGKQLRNNALKWKELLKSAASEGGSSHSNLNAFVQQIASKAT